MSELVLDESPARAGKDRALVISMADKKQSAFIKKSLGVGITWLVMS